MFTVYLAIWFALASGEAEPVILAPFKDVESCLIEAEKLNNRDEQLQSKQGQALGAEAVCLTVRRNFI